MQSEKTHYKVEFTTSVCIEPADSHITVGSEKDKAIYEGKCKKWSAFIGSSTVFIANQFTKTGVRAVNQFAQAVIKDWMGVELPRPGSASLYNNPGRFGLAKVGDEQPRTHTLIVYKHKRGGRGMVGYVLTELEGKEGMAKYQVLYPSDSAKPVGKLTTLDAFTLGNSLIGKNINNYEVAFLRPISTIPLYWNPWIEGADKKTPPTLVAGKEFYYHIDLSAVNFDAFVRHKKAPSPSNEKGGS